MHTHLDLNDPLATAAAAIAAARESAAILRGSLPALLGERSPTAFSLVAGRLERGDVPDAFCRHALETLIARCEQAIDQGTTETITVNETGWGGNGPIYTPERILVRTPEALKILEACQVLTAALEMADRTHDLVVAEAAVMNLRS